MSDIFKRATKFVKFLDALNACEIWDEFKDDFIPISDQEHFDNLSRQIISIIDESDNKEILYINIYLSILLPLVNLIILGKYREAFIFYAEEIDKLENTYLPKTHEEEHYSK